MKLANYTLIQRNKNKPIHTKAIKVSINGGNDLYTEEQTLQSIKTMYVVANISDEKQKKRITEGKLLKKDKELFENFDKEIRIMLMYDNLINA